MYKIRFLKSFLQKTKSSLYSHSFCLQHRIHDSDFTRHRKLSFASVMAYVLSLTQKPMHTEMSGFFRSFFPHPSHITTQALSKARQHISDTAFYQLFKNSYQLADTSLNPHLWHNHLIKVIDGTTFKLPSSQENISAFGVPINQYSQYPIAKASMLYDLSCDLIQDIVIEPYKSSERDHVVTLLTRTSNDINAHPCVYLFDRGYPSRELLSFLSTNKFPYLMRCPGSFLKIIRETTSSDEVVSISYEQMSFPVRVLKFPLSTGETEILLTNLFTADYTVNDFKVLYGKRWGIETKFGELKQRLKIENFSSKKPLLIRQEIFATLYLSNVVSIFKRTADKQLKRMKAYKNWKYQYQANRNYLIGLVLSWHKDILNQTRQILLEEIHQIIQKACQERQAIRPGRHFQRPSIKQRRTVYPMNLKSSI